MKHKKKFYNFITNQSRTELYVYGAIVGGTDKWDETDVTFTDFRDTLDGMADNSTLDILINSPGGDIYTTQAIISMIRRAQERGITVNAYIDGIGASCGSWLPMAADNLYIYSHSILMIHKPLCGIFGNADDMKKEIDVLDKFEDDVIIPMYLEKAKEGVTAEFLKEKMAAETWFSSKEIEELFEVTVLETEKKLVACADRELFKNFINVPENIQELINNEEEASMANIEETPVVEETSIVEEASVAEEVTEEAPVVEEVKPEVETEEVIEETPEETPEVTEEVTEETETVDTEEVTEVENILENEIATLKAEKAELENKLNEANLKVIELNDKVTEMSVIVDKYNADMAAKEQAKNEALLAEKINYYKTKFENMGARAKFESEEVQTLLSNCITDEKALSKLNLMLVDMITISDERIVRNTVEEVSKIENLLPQKETIQSKYGFK